MTIEIKSIDSIHPKELEEESSRLNSIATMHALNYENLNPKCEECPICNSDLLEFFLEKNGLELWRCRSCDFRFTNPYPSNEQLEYFYNSDAIAVEKEIFSKTRDLRINIFENRIDFIHKFCESGALLDIGGALGFFVEALKNRSSNFDISIVDINKAACQKTVEEFPLISVYNQDIIEHEGKYDVITLWDTIEHLPGVTRIIDKIRKLLNDDGYLFLSTPNTKSFEQIIGGRKHPQVEPINHVNYFNQDNLEILLKLNHFKILQTETPNGFFDIAYVKKIITDKSFVNERLGTFLLQCLGNDEVAKHFAQFLIKSKYAGNMIVAAQKKEEV